MKIWIKYGNEEAKIDLEGCVDVADLKDKIHEKFGIQVPSTKLVLKWKGQELKADIKLSSLDLSEACDPQNDSSFLIVQLFSGFFSKIFECKIYFNHFILFFIRNENLGKI